MSLSVASVTVAYNEAKALPLQIDALLRQKRPLQEIVVLDNASNDGTGHLLAEQYPAVTVLTIRENLGVGRAVAAGMAYAALEKRHDWVWILDSDSVPEEDTLQVLLEGISSTEGGEGAVAMAAPLLVHRESGECYPPLFWRDGWVKPSPEQLRKPVLQVDLVLGSGLMVRRAVMEKIGFLRGDLYMYFEDFEYCLRARTHGFKLAVVTGARLFHEVGEGRLVRLGGRRRLWPIHAPWQEYYMTRNLIYACWWLYPNRRTKWFALRHSFRHAGGVLLFSPRKVACLKKMAQGFWDGRRARLGIRFRPE